MPAKQSHGFQKALLLKQKIKGKMDFEELIKKNRSYRRFHQYAPVTMQTLMSLINLARLSASSGNIQGLKYYPTTEADKNEQIFKHLRWAFYLKDWNGPADGERPAAYIIVLWDTAISDVIDTDVGIAAQSILLGAVSKGLGGCMIGSVDRAGLRKELNIPGRFQIPLVIALGKPKEQVLLEELPDDLRIEYWRDTQGVHHVPKRSLEEIIITRFPKE
jgi:nitroreductase